MEAQTQGCWGLAAQVPTYTAICQPQCGLVGHLPTPMWVGWPPTPLWVGGQLYVGTYNNPPPQSANLHTNPAEYLFVAVVVGGGHVPIHKCSLHSAHFTVLPQCSLQQEPRGWSGVGRQVQQHSRVGGWTKAGVGHKPRVLAVGWGCQPARLANLP